MQRPPLHHWLSTSLLSLGITLGACAAHAQTITPLHRHTIAGAVAEIIAATPDGQTIVYTNAGDQKIGFLDIRNPRAPEELGQVDVSEWGEPTSVAVTPNGRYALAVVLDDAEAIADQTPGTLLFIALQNREIVGRVTLAGIGPDSIAITPDGKKAIIVIEDEEDEESLPGDRPGSINFVTINYRNPSRSVVKNTPLALAGIPGVNYAADPQPEFVTISADSKTAAVTLQENNAIAILDIASATVTRIFSAGIVSRDRADLIEDEAVNLDQPFTGRREPDAIAFTPQGHLLIANEGDTDLESFGDGVWSGGRGWSILDLNGTVIYDSGDNLERLAAEQGYYPDDRSENRGIEMEGAAVGRYGNHAIAFVASERGNFVAAYQIANPSQPKLLGILPTGAGPEGLLAIPQRGLFLTANEEDGSVDIFQVSHRR